MTAAEMQAAAHAAERQERLAAIVRDVESRDEPDGAAAFLLRVLREREAEVARLRVALELRPDADLATLDFVHLLEIARTLRQALTVALAALDEEPR